MPSKRSVSGRSANRREYASCSDERMLMPNRGCVEQQLVHRRRVVDADEHERRSRLSEQNALTVMPWSPPRRRAP